MNHVKKTLGFLKKIAVALWWSVTVLVFAAIIGILAAKIKGEIPYFFGYSIMNIVSGSMEDTIPEGSYILIQKTDPAEIRKGDIICFFSDDPAIKGYPNTHTVVEEPIRTENGLEFVTKGDANPLKDSVTAKGDKLIGRYVTRLDMLTSFTRALDGNGILIISVVLLVLCALCMVATAFLKVARTESEDETAVDTAGDTAGGAATDTESGSESEPTAPEQTIPSASDLGDE